MKTLFLVRHAKSSWEEDVVDHQRPLKKRGIADAKLISNHVASHIEKPQLIITSDATRALTTAQFFKESFQIDDDSFTVDNNLYDFSGQQVMKIIKNLNDTNNTVMIVGHNHAFTSIANMLGDKYIDNIPTCGFVKLQFSEQSWKDISTGKTVQTIFPRDLK